MLIHNADITGSLTINGVPYNTGSFTGSFYGDGSQLSGVTSYTNADTLAFIQGYSGSYSGSFSGSFFGDGSNLSGVTSYTDADTLAFINSLDVVSGSIQTVSTVSDTFTSVTSYTVTHNFGTKEVIVSVYENDTLIFPSSINTPTINTVTITFPEPVTGRVVVVKAGHIVSGSINYNSVLNKPTLVSGSSQISFTGITNKPTLVSGSSQITYSGLTGIPSGIVSGSTQVSQFGYATTGSNQFKASQTITGSLTVTGAIVAQTLNVQQVTSSVVFSSGSNRFGNNTGNTHQFTGSVLTSGSLYINGPVSVQANGAILTVLDSTPFASCVGGKISLHGNYRSAGDITEGGYIKVSKANSTDGDYGFDLIFANHTNSSTVSEKMRVSSTGNVGIGLSSGVCQRLTILDNNDAEGLGVFRNFSSASDAGTYIKLGALNGSNLPTAGAEILGVLEAGKTSGYLTFRTYCNSTGQNRMTITSGGCVGVGTVTPEAALHVSTTGPNLLKLTRAGATSANWTFIHGDGGGNGFLYLYNNSSDKNILTLRNDGNVGINITTPQSSLHIIKPLGGNVFAIGEADSNIRFAIGQEAGYTGNYINSSNIDLKLQSYLAAGSGGNIYFQTANDGTSNVSTRLHIGCAGIATFSCQVCAPSFVGGTVTGTRMTVATDCSGVIVDVAGRHGLMKYFNYSTGLVGACSGTDGNISTWLGRFAGSITVPTAVYQDLMINGNGSVTIGTSCAAFGRPLTVSNDIVVYYSSQESITMGLSAGTGQQSWGIQVCDTGDGGSALHLNARGGNVGINKGSGNAASHALDVTGVINSTDRVQAPQIVAGVHKFSSTAANTFYTAVGSSSTFNINIAGSTGLQVAGNYQTAEITFQAGLYPGSTTIIGKILVVNRGGAFSCNFYSSTGVGGVGTIGVVPYSNGSSTFGVCLTSDCTSSAVYWAAIVNAMSV